MSIKRFVGPNAREAMAQVRRELGDDALVLSTKKLTGGRIEVLAAAPEEVAGLIEEARSSRSSASMPAAPSRPVRMSAQLPAPRLPVPTPMTGTPRQAPASASPPSFVSRLASRSTGVARIHAPGAAVQTESLEGFLRRQARQQQAAATAHAAETPMAVAAPALEATRRLDAARPNDDAVAQRLQDRVAPGPDAGALILAAAPAVFRRRDDAADSRAAGTAAPDAQMPVVESAVPVVAPAAAPSSASRAAPTAQADSSADAQLLAELQSMRALMLEQMSAMNVASTAGDIQRRNPMQLRAMTRLLTAGLSAEVARQIAQRVPHQADAAAADRWLTDVLTLNVKCAAAGEDIIGRGGVYALVGPTGVGKTTTIAKLAARFAVRQGAQSLGLITLDAYRVGAHEQLRSYGRILGVPVHLAQDAVTLRELLASMPQKKLVLIDTCGVSQRDERLQEALAMLEQAAMPERPIESVLLLNAASHAETLDDVARAWRTPQQAGTILTKLDEAARIGGALDCVLRRKLRVLGMTNGQRVPEDWVAADSRLLAAAALKPGATGFALSDADGALLAAQADETTAPVIA